MLDDPTRCPECQKTMKTIDLVRHVGVTHKYLQRFILNLPAESSQADGKAEERKKRSFIEDEDDVEYKEDGLSSPGKRIQLTHQHKYLEQGESPKHAVTQILEEMIETATLTNTGHHGVVRPIIEQILEKVTNHQ